MIAKLGLVGVGLLLPLLLFEGALRLTRGAPPDLLSGSKVPDPVLGWRPPVNAGYREVNSEFNVEVRYNSRGWRDVEHELEKPEGVYRIVVLGDSFMEAHSVELDEMLARQIDRAVDEVEVINLGVGGFGTLQQLRAFETEGQRYQPDLVLLGLFLGNDIRNNSLELEKRLWVSRNRGGDDKVTSRPFLLAASEGPWVTSKVDFAAASARYEAAMAAATQGIDSRLQRGSAVYFLLRGKLKQLLSGAPGSGPLDYQAVDGEAWLGVYGCPPTEAYENAWEVTDRILARLAQRVREQGGELAVFSVPARQEVEPDFRKRALERVEDPSQYCVEEPPGNARLAEILASHNVPFYDLLPAFRKTAQQQVLFRDTDDHWNPVGHALAAETVVEALRADQLLP